MLTDYDFPGNSYLATSDFIDDAKECQQLCANHPNCTYFTLTAQKICFFKWGEADMSKESKLGYFSGPANCDTSSSIVNGQDMPKDGK